MLSDENHSPLPRRKPRACLCCTHAFDSGWAGERICPHCKASTIWREDLAGSTDNHARYGGKVRGKGIP